MLKKTAVPIWWYAIRIRFIVVRFAYLQKEFMKSFLISVIFSAMNGSHIMNTCVWYSFHTRNRFMSLKIIPMMNSLNKRRANYTYLGDLVPHREYAVVCGSRLDLLSLLSFWVWIKARISWGLSCVYRKRTWAEGRFEDSTSYKIIILCSSNVAEKFVEKLILLLINFL